MEINTNLTESQSITIVEKRLDQIIRAAEVGYPDIDLLDHIAVLAEDAKSRINVIRVIVQEGEAAGLPENRNRDGRVQSTTAVPITFHSN